MVCNVAQFFFIGTFMELVALLQKQGVVENVKAVIEKIVASALPALINQNLEVRCTLEETNKNSTFSVWFDN